MLSPDSATGGYARTRKGAQHYAAAHFDRGARALAFCCAVLYAVLTAGLVLAIVKATLRL